MKLFPSSELGMFGRRQRHMRGHRIPVTISRKASPSDGDRIVSDAFGVDDVAALPGGCPCCTVRVKLQTALLGLLTEREQKPFSRIAIETGEALPPILRTFVSERALGDEYYVEATPALEGNGFTLMHDAPFSWDAFSRFITTLTALRGTDLLRAKGLLNIAGCRGPIAVQVMGHLSARPIELQAWPSDDRASRLAFVTQGIEAQTICALFDSVRATA